MSKTRYAVRKYLKYTLMVAAAEALYAALPFLAGATTFTGVDWAGCADTAALVLVKSLIGGAVGILANVPGIRAAGIPPTVKEVRST